uniref:F-box domain-containing protein n=1 Tax=Oryza barthii TaxID=65489 RepID=A0A0D3G3T2_9ORYZ
MAGTSHNSSSKRPRRTAPPPPPRDNPAERLTDDLLVEILSRVPYMSLCRSKRVCRRWRRVISDPDHRRLLPRYHLHNAIAGIFSMEPYWRPLADPHRFQAVPAADPPPPIDTSFSFLPKCERIRLLDGCNGLILCCRRNLSNPDVFNYVVCNPATKNSFVLPDLDWCCSKIERLGFDPAVSSHFHVFEFAEYLDIDGYDHYLRLNIYSSKTGEWSGEMDSGWSTEVGTLNRPKTVFFNGMLHLLAVEPLSIMDSKLVAVDVEGKTWRTIRLPHDEEGHPLYGAHHSFTPYKEELVDLSQGLLHFVSTASNDATKLSVWVLDDYDSERWSLQHIVSSMHLLGRAISPYLGYGYVVVSVQERKMFFVVFGRDRMLMSYEIDKREVRLIHKFGRGYEKRYLPYLPLFTESLADGCASWRHGEGIQEEEGIQCDEESGGRAHRRPHRGDPLPPPRQVGRWRRLISDPHHSKKLSQTLAGFFHLSVNESRFPVEARHFVNVSGRGGRLPHICPSFSFLPRFERISMVDSCGGLLLCQCFESSDAFRYVVFNPCTEEWIVLPESGFHPKDRGFCARLGLDPDVSSQFHVFEFVPCDDVTGVKIYSSETREWNYRESEWCTDTGISDICRSAFCNAFGFLSAFDSVDVEGRTWRTTKVPKMEGVEEVRDWLPGSICQSEGKLYYLSQYNTVPISLSIWLLEDYSKDEWTLKHSVTNELLSEKINSKYKSSEFCCLVIVHLDCNLIYYITRDYTLMAYDMDHKESRVIQALGSDCILECLPYVPLYAETLDGDMAGDVDDWKSTWKSKKEKGSGGRAHRRPHRGDPLPPPGSRPSRRWRGLISDPDHRKKLPQTLAGFFYHSENESRFPMEARHFINVSGRGRPLVYPSFSFLPRFESIRMVDSCGGLLLCRCFESSDASRYVVCNPTTEELVALPESSYDAEGGGEEEMCARLGFDPDVSSQFHVFQFVTDARLWLVLRSTLRKSENGITVLEDYSKDEWTLKHKVTIELLSGKISCKYQTMFYRGVAVHLDCNLVYYIADYILMSYDMDRKEPRVIQDLGSDCMMEYLPYVPLYAKTLNVTIQDVISWLSRKHKRGGLVALSSCEARVRAGVAGSARICLGSQQVRRLGGGRWARSSGGWADEGRRWAGKGRGWAELPYGGQAQGDGGGRRRAEVAWLSLPALSFYIWTEDYCQFQGGFLLSGSLIVFVGSLNSMGSSPSKATGEDALVLCKERMRHIKRAIDSRDALSASHLSYTQSLRSVGTALRRYAEFEISTESSLSISEADKSPSHSSMASPSPSQALESTGSPVHRGSQLTPPSTKIHYMKAAGTKPLTITIDPSAADFVGQESLVSTFVPPPPPLPPELCTSWDFFDSNYASGSATSNNENGVTLNFSRLKGLRDSRESEAVSLREEATNRSDGMHPELPGDNAAPKQEAQAKKSGMSKPSGSVEVTTEAATSGQVGEKVEEDDMEKELCTEAEDPSEFITHRAKDFKLGMRFPECLRQRRSDLIYVLRFQVLQASHLLPDLCQHFESASIVRIFSTRSPLTAAMITDDVGDSNSDFVEQFAMVSGSHSSTLDRLHAWERKLHDEIKASEHVRKTYDEKCNLLRHQFARGLNAQLIDKTRAIVKDLHSRVSVAIQAVDAISKRIEKIRDEELQPQLVELIQGLIRMWKTMLECHHKQFITISLAYHVKSATTVQQGEHHHRAATHLWNELDCFSSSFKIWVTAHKSYVESLNAWLQKCVLQPAQDRRRRKRKVSFPPRHALSPPIFVLCRDWLTMMESQSLPTDELCKSIKEVVQLLRGSFDHQADHQNKMTTESHLRNESQECGMLENNEQEVSGSVEAVEGLQSKLTTVLDRLTKFSEASLKHYEELKQNYEMARDDYKMGRSNAHLLALPVDMAKKSKLKKEGSSTTRNPAAELTDDLIVDILSRLPAKRWRGLISDPDHRKKLPQTLAGFFYSSENESSFPDEARHFVNVTGRGRPLVHPSLPFLPRFERIRMVDSCGGLLLCRCYESSNAFRYVVCNPAMEEWVALPESGYGDDKEEVELCTRLGFDPAVSSHFHVFEFVSADDCSDVAGVKIYSSETGEWNYSESEWFPDTVLFADQRSVFFNGMLHLVVLQLAIVAVDVKGETWWNMPVPEMEDVEDIFTWRPGFIGQSQGKLYYLSEYDTVPLSLSIWVLEDDSTDEWTLKHNVTTELLSEKINSKTDIYHSDYYHVATVHPDCGLIYYIAGRGGTLMAYDMDRMESRAIQNLEYRYMEFLPYIPFYSEILSNGD